jgi:hypothetical protein
MKLLVNTIKTIVFKLNFVLYGDSLHTIPCLNQQTGKQHPFFELRHDKSDTVLYLLLRVESD